MPAESNSTIKAVILDYGEVLCHTPAPQFIQSMADVFKLSPQAFRAIYDRHRLPYDRGDYSPEAYWSKFEEETNSKLLPAQLQQLRNWDVDMWSNVDPAMLAWVDTLRAHGLKIALLSNMHADMARHFRMHFDWVNKFETAILSAEMRSVKPEPEIYLRTVEALGVRPEEALFIDDRERNTRGAEQVGIRAVRFESMKQLASELERLGLNLPAPLSEKTSP